MSSISPRQISILLIPILLGTFLLLYGTATYGVGVSRDSIAYLNVARNLAEHGALITDYAPGPPQPLTLWPALYPALLAPFDLINLDVLHSIRILNIVLFGLYIIAIQWLILRSTRSSVPIAFAAGLFVVFSEDTLRVYSRVWSETLFLVLLLYGMLLLCHFLQNKNNRYSLLFGASLFALAWLTRYVGITLLITGGIAILLWSDQPLRRRLRDGILFGFVAAVPMGLLMLYNFLLASSATGRALGFSPLPKQWFRQGINTVGTWLAPASAPRIIKSAAAAVILALSLVGVLFTVQEARNEQRSSDAKERTWVIPATLLLFALVYILFVVGAASIVNTATWPYSRVASNARIGSPLYSVLIVVAAYTVHRLFENSSQMRPLIAVAILCSAMLISYQLWRSAQAMHLAHVEGIQHNSRSLHESAVLNTMRTLPENLLLQSNDPKLIFFLTDRRAYSIGEIPCNIECTSLRNQFQDLTAEPGAPSYIIWASDNNAASCKKCIKPLTDEFGFELTDKDDLFWLYRLSPAE